MLGCHIDATLGSNTLGFLMWRLLVSCPAARQLPNAARWSVMRLKGMRMPEKAIVIPTPTIVLCEPKCYREIILPQLCSSAGDSSTSGYIWQHLDLQVFNIVTYHTRISRIVAHG